MRQSRALRGAASPSRSRCIRSGPVPIYILQASTLTWPIEANGERIEAGTIPGGRCAVLRIAGNTDNLEPATLYLYRDWLPASGEEAGDFPSIANASPSSRKCRSMRPSRSCFFR